MYSNVFDSARPSSGDPNTIALLYTSILNGQHPTLTLNQVVDSPVILSLVRGDPYFRKLIERDIIKIAPYTTYPNAKNPIIGYMEQALQPVEGLARNPFQLSCLSRLGIYNGKYTDGEIQKIYNEMLAVLLGERSSISRDRGAYEDVEGINEYVQSVIDIYKAVGERYLPVPSPHPNKTLWQRIEESMEILKNIELSKGSEIDLYQALLELDDRLSAYIREGRYQEGARNSRSVLYKMIEKMDCSDSNVEEELRALIDLHYNETVAGSIDDQEDAVMEIEKRFSQVQKCSELTTRERHLQALSMMENNQNYDGDIMTWEKLYSIVDTTLQDHPLTQKEWKQRVIHNCKKLGFHNLKMECEDIAINCALIFAKNYFMPDELHPLEKLFYILLLGTGENTSNIIKRIPFIEPAYQDYKTFKQIRGLVLD